MPQQRNTQFVSLVDRHGLPKPDKNEQEHQFTSRCIQHKKLSMLLPGSKHRASYAHRRYTAKDEQAFIRGKTAEIVDESQERGSGAFGGQSGLYLPETGNGERGGEPVTDDAEAKKVAEHYAGLLTEPTLNALPQQKEGGWSYRKPQGSQGRAEANKDRYAKESEAQKEKVGQGMHEFKEGTLKSGSGRKVTDRDQAIAISLRQAGVAKPRNRGK